MATKNKKTGKGGQVFNIDIEDKTSGLRMVYEETANTITDALAQIKSRFIGYYYAFIWGARDNNGAIYPHIFGYYFRNTRGQA